MIRKITILLVTITLMVSILPHVLPDVWFIDLLAHFKVQFLVIFITLLLLSSIIRNKKFIVIGSLIGVVWNSFFVVPLYIETQNNTSEKENPLSLVCLNLLLDNTSYDSVRNFLIEKNPDVIILLEYHTTWTEPMKKLASSYPYRKLIPRSDHFGIALLSRIPMEIHEETFDGTVPPTLIGNFHMGNQPVTLIATHPFPPMREWRFDLRNHQLKLLISSMDKWSENVILTGDLNTSSFSTVFRKFLKEGGLSDTRTGYGPQPTWPAAYWPLQTTLDHCLIRGNISVITRQTGPPVGSDHLPLYIELAPTL